MGREWMDLQMAWIMAYSNSCHLTPRSTYLAASFMPQSSEQYLEPGRVG